MELRRQKFSKILLCGIFALIFAAFSTHPTHALDVIQKDLIVSSHSPTITINNNGIVSGSSKVAPNIEFNKLGDFITYKLTLHNNDGKKYQITSVTDDNTNDAIELTYAHPTDLDTSDKSLELTIKYVKRSTTPLQTITIAINLVDEDYLNQQISLTVPNTGANTVNNTSSTNIRNIAIIYIIIATAIIIVYITIRSRYQKFQKSTKLPRIITATLLLVGLIPLAVIAANLKDLQFIVEFSNIKFNGPYTITFNTTTTDTIAPQTIDHNTLAQKPGDPQKTGYTFSKWLDENNQEFDFTKPVTKDYDLTAEYTINTYTVTFVTNDNNSQVLFHNVDYNDFVSPPADPVKTGYVFEKWLDENNQEFDFNTPITDDIKLTASYTVGNYPITYNDNGANSPTTMSDQIIKGTDTEIVLWPSNFKYPGRGFAGWNTKADGKGTRFGPNETITDQTVLNEIKTNGLTLYAMWVESAGNFQTWRGCNAMNVGDVTALTDTRDNNVYAIAKLADGNCWMIENLRLDNTNSDNATGALAQGYNSSFIGLADPEDANFSDTDAANSLYSTNGSTAAPAITGDGLGSRFPRYNNKSTTDPATKMDSAEEPYIYSQGNYYTWSAVIADTSHYATDNQAVADTSICPKGWRLPTGGEYDVVGQNADFHKLAVSVVGEEPHTTEYYGVVYYGETTGVNASNKLRAYPNNFTYDGYYNGNRPSTTRGSRGGYWSSTSAGAQKAYGFGFDVDLVGTGSYTKSLGFPVRCLASGTYTIIFDSNGGSGNMNNQVVNVDTTTALSPNAFTHSKLSFIGWNTSADGNGTSYTNKQDIIDIAQPGQKITLYAQWAPTITYNDNGANSTTTMDQQIIKTSDTRVTLWASNFQRPGYGFAGWNTRADGNGTSFGPNQIISNAATMEEIKANSLTLYAMWIPSAGDLQSWGGCPSLSQGGVTALTDDRDGNTYAVAKLADDKCWMIENMRLSNTHIENGNPVVINSANTNNPAIGFALNDPQELASNAWCNDRNADCANKILYAAINTRDTVQKMSNYSGNIYSYGNYYNWYTATAGTGTYSLDSGNAAGSICPAGWHLPSGNTNGEFSKLDFAMGGSGSNQSGSGSVDAVNNWISFPVNSVGASRISAGGYYLRGSSANHWTSTPVSSSTNAGSAYVMYVLYGGMSTIWPGDNHNNYKIYGSTVRCIKD